MIRSFFQLLTIAWFGATNAGRWSKFNVVWNAPTKQCRNWTKLERPENYGILTNSGYEFQGDTIVVFYEDQFGLYPYYRNFSDPSSAVNGGIPQHADLTAHLKKVHDDIEKAIPSSNFNGLAVIDYEKWRPLWEQNWHAKQIYQRESLAHAAGHCSKNDRNCKFAIDEFNSASLNFLVETIREAKKTRPNALWGYYGMPFCNYTAGKNGTIACGEVYNKFNDRLLLSLYNESTALYPSIYIHSSQEGAANCRYVISVLQETERVAKKLHLPIFTYTSFEYFPLKSSDPYYTERDLHNSLRKAFQMNVDGAIIWTTSNGMARRCNDIGDYVHKHLGPEASQIQKLIKNFNKTEMARLD
ncbi:unnamed protein product [Litomosoides sigmodontis]|uniref:Hyaluronidase n=1 Tax=Litomosoides sigmodontis TaxID=42156 RepID=A0A3P6TU06_LITSI|nr:unnamed protein product [Litomosoides sigmodontis]